MYLFFVGVLHYCCVVKWVADETMHQYLLHITSNYILIFLFISSITVAATKSLRRKGTGTVTAAWEMVPMGSCISAWTGRQTQLWR